MVAIDPVQRAAIGRRGAAATQAKNQAFRDAKACKKPSTCICKLCVIPEPCKISTRAHVWRIESPAGPTSRGVCKLCGWEKLFRNWIEDYSFMPDYGREAEMGV